MAAELEEVVPDSDRARARAPPAQMSASVSSTASRGRRAASVASGSRLRRGQRAAVDLAGWARGGARSATNAPGPCTRAASAAGILAAPSVAGLATVGDRVARRAAGRRARPRARRRPRLADAGWRDQRGLDLAELDAEAADLDLVVDAAEEFERAVGAATDEVAGAVEARAGASERVGDESLGRQLRPVEVAAGDAVAADVRARRARRPGPAAAARRGRRVTVFATGLPIVIRSPERYAVPVE